MYSLLVPTGKKRSGQFEKDQEEDSKDDQMAGKPDMRGKVERIGLVQRLENKA